MRKILIAEDDEDDRLLLKMALTTGGFEVVEAVDGKAALEHLQQDTFQAIVSDIHMPEMNGVELAQVCQEIFPDIPFYAVTGLSDTFYAEMMLSFGADSIFMKSADYADLIASLKQMLE